MIFVHLRCTMKFNDVHAFTTSQKVNDYTTGSNIILKKGQQEAVMFQFNDRNNHDTISRIIT